MALSKEKKKGCLYTVLGTCQKTFVTGCNAKNVNILSYYLTYIRLKKKSMKELVFIFQFDQLSLLAFFG